MLPYIIYRIRKNPRIPRIAFILVPSPLVEKRSDPYHGSVLPLNYEGGMLSGYPPLLASEIIDM